jgi:MATE family multidrug resistance protein
MDRLRTCPSHARALSWEHRPTRELLRLAWPICVSLLSFNLMTLTDTLFVGQLGTGALAGVGVGGVLTFSILCFPMGVMRGGVKVLIAQRVGAGQRDRVLAVVGAGLILATALAALAVGGAAASTALLPTLIPGDGGVHAATYILVRAIGVPLVLWSSAMREGRYGLGDSRSPMVAAVISNLSNIGLDAVFIFGLDMGVAGAALASVIAQGIDAALLLGVQVREGLGLRRVRLADLRAVLRLGLPTGLQGMVEVGAFALITMLLARRSDLDVAAHQIALQVEHIAFLPTLAVADAAGVLAGQAVGARRLRMVLGLAHRALVLTVGYSALCTVVFLLAAGSIAGAFTSEAELLGLVVTLLHVAAVFLVIDGAQVIARCVLRAAGDVNTVAIMTVTASWVITPPLTIWLGLELGWGATGAWLGICAEIFLISAVLWWRLERLGWRRAAFRSRRALWRPAP